MAESKEYSTILNCELQLKIALKSDREIALFLHQRGIIKKELYDEINEPKSMLSATDKVGKLVTAIRDKVSLNRDNYHLFVNHMRLNPRVYGDIVDILDREYHGTSVSPASINPPSGNTRHMEAYYKAIKEKITLMIKVVRLVHAGIPRSGKSTTIKRLAGDILNICSLDVKISPSTGVGKQEGQIIVTRKMSSDMKAKLSEWSRLKGFMKEDSLLKHLLESRVQREKSDKKNATNKSLQENRSASSDPSRVHKEATREEIHEMMSPPPTDTAKDPAEDKDLEEFKNLLSNLHMLLINTDTGGHFLDMLSAFIMGPSLYLLYHKLSNPLDKPFDIYFTDDKGKDTEKVESTSTVEECLFQILSSIDCHSKPKGAKEESAIWKGATISSRALFVGTHRDKVTSDELLKKQNDLKKKVEKMDVYKNGTLLFPKGEPILAVDNYEGDDKERNDMKDTLTDLIDHNFEEIEIPAAWLILSLYIRKDLQANRIMSLEDCREQAKKLEIDSEELNSALWFLHHYMGLIFYFPEVKEIENIIFCDMQVIYDSITQLIVYTFGQQFQENGMFSDDDLRHALGSGSSNHDLHFHELVALLKHLNILTTISDKGKKTYFMPCVLNNATDDELKSMLKTVEESIDNPTPLMLQYSCGYVPVGTFPHMVANIASQWTLAEYNVIKKNIVNFSVRGYEVILILRLSNITVAFSCPLDNTVELSRDRFIKISNEKICPYICKEIRSSLEKVAKCMNYENDIYLKYEIGLYHNGTFYKRKNNVECQSDHHTDKLTMSQQIWFSECTDDPIGTGQRCVYLTDITSEAARKRIFSHLPAKSLTEGEHESQSQSILYKDERIPGVVLVKDKRILEKISSVGKTIDHKNDAGITIDVPEGSISPDESVDLLIQPCFSGSFEIPKDMKPASPAYLIETSKQIVLKKPLKMKMQHSVKLQTEEDCKNILFLRASSDPDYRGVYTFKEVEDVKGTFTLNSQFGEVALTNFSWWRTFFKIRRIQGEIVYSARLYRSPNPTAKASAVFCMCPHHLFYTEFCDTSICKEYSGISEKAEDRTVSNIVAITGDKVALKSQYGSCTMDKSELKKAEIDLPETNYQEPSEIPDYPPRINITNYATTKPLELSVKGLNDVCTFTIPATSNVNWMGLNPNKAITIFQEYSNVPTKRFEQTPSKLAEKHEEQLTEGQTSGRSEQSGLARYISRIPKENQYMLKKKLDFQHEGVEEHLAKIADAFVDWEINLANLMGLTRIEVEDILAVDVSKPRLQRRKALRKWREKNGLDATYERILEICVKGNNDSCADVIVKLLGGL